MTASRSSGSSNRTAKPDTTSLITDRSKLMNLIQEDLARAHMSARLGEAQSMRRGHQLVRSRRLSRRAERAAQQARLAIARSF